MIFGSFFKKMFGSRNDRLLRQYQKMVVDINNFSDQMADWDDDQVKAQTALFKDRLAQGETLDQILPEAFATVREAAQRTLGLRHYDVQLIGGIALHQGKISEMRMGEGKTLVATAPAYLNAISGNGVHIVTVNDYLAQRDAEWMRPIYEFLGLTVAVNLTSMEAEQKREAYAADILFGTNNEYGFDYLRDNMAYAMDQRVQRELSFAIIDEVDSILIDEARTPLIISGQAEASSDLYQVINKMIPKLKRQERAGDDPKEEPLTEEEKGDYVLDEKNRQAHLTDGGHDAMEKMLLESGELAAGASLYDVNNISLMHYVNASLRANTLYQLDVDYIVKDNKVVIVDEHTGRLMDGRRWSDGLHQAVEAKENVPIELENHTLATITFQNFFRLYDKLSGMTGTADTEAFEFQKIYNLEVVVIPTHRPLIRKDKADRIYLTARGKYKAILEEIKERNATKQPILVGTASIETSELLSNMLKENKVTHEVLNAKQHEREAMIVAQAGMPGALTIATNMAGRGTDIVLGGNLEVELEAAGDLTPEQTAKHEEDWKQRQDMVISLGGLHVLGTERNESRRIDNQLRGRSGRQGDPGSSSFFLSMEDNLMRLFAVGMMSGIVKKLGFTEYDVIEHPMLNRSIEKAQRRVEGMNFDIRKQLLEYDDVANDQRKVIYEQRLKLLSSDDISKSIKNLTEDVAERMAERHVPEDSMVEEWDLEGLDQALAADFDLSLNFKELLDNESNFQEDAIAPRITEALREKLEKKKAEFGEESMRDLEKQMMLQTLDQHWKDHLSAMDHLRQGIHLRGYAQKNPAQEYKRECFDLFTDMMQSLKYEVISTLARVEFASEDQIAAMQAEQSMQAPNITYQHQDLGQITSPAAAEEVIAEESGPPTSPEQQATPEKPIVNGEPKVGRNDPCPCGSGKKYKQCCGKLS